MNALWLIQPAIIGLAYLGMLHPALVNAQSPLESSANAQNGIVPPEIVRVEKQSADSDTRYATVGNDKGHYWLFCDAGTPSCINLQAGKNYLLFDSRTRWKLPGATDFMTLAFIQDFTVKYTEGENIGLIPEGADGDTPEAITRLRHFILNLAVRGKLVLQDSKNEPASELLKRVAAEKARLVKVGEIAKEKALPPLKQDDLAFDLPHGWKWVRLGDLSKLVTSGSRDWAKHYSNEGAIFVRMGNLSKGHYRLRLDHIQRVKAPSDGEGTRTRLESGDILISITGDVGMLGLIPEGFGEAYINQHTAMVRPMPEIKGRYLAELFRSPFAQDQFKGPQRGIKNSFRLTDVTQFVVPLPPLVEQHHIVAKVDELMALCDRLEASLAAAVDARRKLLKALLAEALLDTKGKLEAEVRHLLPLSGVL